MLAILDYNAGNQTSVKLALDHLKIPNIITNDVNIISSAQGIIFPGVGAAGQAMDNLHQAGLAECLSNAKNSNQPILGICLGCQILLDESEENMTKTLGLLSGSCHLFDKTLLDYDNTQIKIPHMGWNSLNVKQKTLLLDDVDLNSSFYFVHSYYVKVKDNLCLATCTYGLEFCALYGYDGLWAMQFHPEKSGEAGLKILHNFYKFCCR